MTNRENIKYLNLDILTKENTFSLFNKKIVTTVLVATIALAISPFAKVEAATTAAKVECGDITIANMNWQSAEFLAEVDKFILSNAFGCNASLIAGDTVPTITSMSERNKPDIAPEMWTSSVKEIIEKTVAEGRLYVAGSSLSDGGVEGWWIPKYFAEANPQIKTIEDALKHPELFPHPEISGKGAVYNCPSGWACQISTRNIYNGWKADDKGFVLVDTGSAAGLDGSIARAYERKEAWLGYYWAPTSILGKYEMVRLDAGVPFNQKEWDRCTSKDLCTDPVPNDWSKSEVVILVNKKVNNVPQVYEYLTKRSMKNDTVNGILAWMGDSQANGEDGAIYFLKNHEDVWKNWLSQEAFDKVKAAIK